MAKDNRFGFFWRVLNFLGPVLLDRFLASRMQETPAHGDDSELKAEVKDVRGDLKDVAGRLDTLQEEQNRLRLRIIELEASLGAYKLLVGIGLPVVLILLIVVMVMALR
jgi:hypothetical protein